MFIILVKDILEILFYSSIFYTFCIWLKTDRTKNIVPYFLSYCMLMLCAWVIELPTLTPFLFTYAPIALLLFIIIHEKTLQRNLITLHNIQPAQQTCLDWLDILISSSLSILNSNKSITIAIECQNSLHNFLTTPFFINADISKEMLDILLSSSSYDEHKIVWINTQGKLYGINASWYLDNDQKMSVTKIADYKSDAYFYSLHTDVIIIYLDYTTRQFSLITQGNEINHLSAHQLHTLIKKQLYRSSTVQKGKYNENVSSQKSITE